MEFCGACPIVECPGNCSRPELPNACLFLWYGRTRLDKSDILFSRKVNERVFQDNIQQGQRQADLVLSLFKLLNRLRTEDSLQTCPRCGIGLTSQKIACADPRRCQERQSFAQTILTTSYLRFPEFKTQYKDIYLLARKSRVLEAHAKRENSNINQLLGLDARLIKAFLTANPVA